MMNWINKKRNKKGFTLVELVVVIAILGILAAIAVPRLGKSRNSAKIAQHNANVSAIKSAASMYIADNPDGTINGTNVGPYLEGGVMPDVPTDLKDNDGTSVTIPTGGKYTVVLNTNGDIEVTPGPIK